MITLKEPLKLHSIHPLSTPAEGFAQRILGNYTLMGAHIAPKDLLFALNSPPDAKEEPAGMTTIAVQNNVTDQQTVVMDIVNNIVNRILLNETPSFTYQDTVYLETALRKIGIENTQLFLSQVSQLQQEKRSLSSLFQFYQQQAASSKGKDTLSQEQRLHSQTPLKDKAVEAAENQNLSLYQEIFQRLATASIYQTMVSYFSELSSVSSVAEHRVLQLAEQNWTGRYLTVQQQYRQRHIHQQLSLSYAVNRYETPGFPVLPQQEEQVLSQAAAAALFSSISHVMTQRFSQEISENTWQDFTHSLSQTIENTLSRFETSYGGSLYYEYPYREGDSYTVSQTPPADLLFPASSTSPEDSLSEETIPLLKKPRATPEPSPTKMQLSSPQADNETAFSPAELIYPAPSGVEHLSASENSLPETPQAFSETSAVSVPEKDTISEIIREEVQHSVPSTSAAVPPEKKTDISPIEIHLSEQSQLPDVPSAEISPARLEFPRQPAAQEPVSPLQQKSSSPSTPPTVGHTAQRQQIEKMTPPAAVSDTILEEIRRISHVGEQLQPPSSAKSTVQKDSSLLAQGNTISESSAEMQFSPASKELFMPSESPASREEVLVRELREIDRNNREIQKRIEQQRLISSFTARPQAVIDKKRVMSDALRAVNAPEQVIKEILQAPPAHLEHLHLSPEAEFFLSQTDSTTREILRTALAYQENPQAAAASGKVAPGNLAQLNLENRLPEQLSDTVVQQTEQQRQEITELQKTRRTLLDEIQQAKMAASPAAAPEKERRITPVRFVYKQEGPPPAEDENELNPPNRTATKTEDSISSVTRHTVQQSEIHSMNNRISVQTAEDIQALVNRTLSKQMNVITDRVYQQMEKRLQTERFRRGRF